MFHKYPELARKNVQDWRKGEEAPRGVSINGPGSSIEDAAVGDGGYVRWEWNHDPVFLPFLYSVPWGFVGDPETKWIIEHKVKLVFHKGICQVELQAFGDIDLPPLELKPDANMELHWNEFHWADYRKALIHNNHLGYDHGVKTLNEKIFQAAREMEAYFKKTGICEGYLAPEPKILVLESIGVPEGTSAAEYVAFRMKFKNTGREQGSFQVWIDQCDTFTGKPDKVWYNLILSDGISSVLPGETKTADVVVHIMENAPASATCRVSLKYSFRDGEPEKKIVLEDKKEITLTRSVVKTKPEVRPGEPETSAGCARDGDCGRGEYCRKDIKACVAKSQCTSVIQNGGSSNKIDLVFVGDGYPDPESLKRDIHVMMGNGAHGLWSEEPFRSNQNKFNVWMINSEPNQLHPAGSAAWPNRGASLALAGKCPQSDFPVVISKSNFRSFAYFDGEAYISLGYNPERDWGLVLLHELGHSFGGLADEYVEPSIGNYPRNPNCAPDRATAESWWGGVPGAGYFSGCSYQDQNIRPTEHSLMRELSEAVGYGSVNSNALKSKLNRY